MIFSVSLNMKTKYSPYSMTTIWFYVVTTQNNTGLINIFNILLLSLSKQSATKSKLEIKGKGKKQTRNDTGKKKSQNTESNRRNETGRHCNRAEQDRKKYTRKVGLTRETHQGGTDSLKGGKHGQREKIVSEDVNSK